MEVYTMPIEEIITRVTDIAHKYNVKRLDLFGSFANGTATEYSDIDFIIYGCDNIDLFEEEVQNIPTLRKIDIFNYDEVCSPELREDMDKYGKQIY
ncbi:nucleotidyltransferase family protein [Pseudobutyrivibrio sp. MD2005]|uniref:nucleotidyltransferase family protein n=1 Tax=Pseudobutyrivibrio sp. MD2005 TaxID=1410616 RepID=UPI00056237E6|nr:nucleotidyltransferase domain-containing protein [Pseudobutyrivibrio sp. MD2005]